MLNTLFLSLNDAPSLKDLDYTGTSGLYARVRPIPSDADYLSVDICGPLGITDFDINDLHCTVMYSPDDCPAVDDLPEISPAQTQRATLSEVIHWTGHDGKTYVVAALKSTALTKIHKQLKSVGCTPSYDDYRPHITLQKFEGPVPKEMQIAINKLNVSLAESQPVLTLTDFRIGDVSKD